MGFTLAEVQNQVCCVLLL